VLLLRSIRDMNAPKFIVQDMPLFNALMSDLFPGTLIATDDLPCMQVLTTTL
jgi:dynein heavy chain